MHLLHERVEVCSPLPVDSNLVTEQVHQHRLARPWGQSRSGRGGMEGRVGSAPETGLAVQPTYRTPHVDALDFSFHC